jgi:hypothetical protein
MLNCPKKDTEVVGLGSIHHHPKPERLARGILLRLEDEPRSMIVTTVCVRGSLALRGSSLVRGGTTHSG